MAEEQVTAADEGGKQGVLANPETREAFVKLTEFLIETDDESRNLFFACVASLRHGTAEEKARLMQTVGELAARRTA